MSLFIFLLAIGISPQSQMTQLIKYRQTWNTSINLGTHFLLVTCIYKMISVILLRNKMKITVKSAMETIIFQCRTEMIRISTTETRFTPTASLIGQIQISFIPTKPMKKPTYLIRCLVKKFKTF